MARGRPRKTAQAAAADNGATVGYEAQLWKMADALRGSMDAAEYKHVVLGLIFLKYVSDAFEELHRTLEAERAEGADPEDPDEYRAQNVFWVPREARWSQLKAKARQPEIGRLVDEAMAAIERDNPALAGVLPKDYARPALDKVRLGQLVDLISNIEVGNEAARAKDVLGRVYEDFLAQFASAEGKKGGEFYTPRCIVKLLVEMLEPYHGRVYDPCCGSSGMFVQSIAFIRAHATGNGNGGRTPRGVKKPDISIYGQESNYTTWRLAKMNLAIRGIDGQIAHGDTFRDDLFLDRLVDSELGEIPEGWECETLADLSTLKPEVWTHETRPSRINYVDLSNTKWGRIEALTSHDSTNAPSRAQRVLRPGDTIVGTVRPGNGSYAFISEDELTGSTSFAVLRPRRRVYAEFVDLAATAADNIDLLGRLADGAAYPAVRPQVVSATRIVRTSDEVLVWFSKQTGSISAQIWQIQRESRTLAAIRDTLFAKLVSGELRVKDAEKFLENAGV